MGKNVHAAQKGVAVCMLHVGQHRAAGRGTMPGTFPKETACCFGGTSS